MPPLTWIWLSPPASSRRRALTDESLTVMF